MTEEDRIRSLSPRQREVVMHMLAGLCNKEICAAMGITLKTLKTHTGTVYLRLGTRDRYQLMARLMVPRQEWQEQANG